jgi:cytochrome c
VVIIMRRSILPCFVASMLVTAQAPLIAQPLDGGDPASGRLLATRLCSSCHRVLPMTLSDKADPPSFQSIADEPSTTGLSLNVFLHSNHNNMPDLVLSATESKDLIAYILSLKK